MRKCRTPISDEALVDYWAGDGPADEVDRIEAHLFDCGDCAARLAQVASLSRGLAALLREGRATGMISRALVNRLQRDGVSMRVYTVSPGETVPCAAFPGDDFVVASLRADFSGVDAVTLSVTGPGDSPVGEFDDVPVARTAGEVCWALPGAVVRQMPSTRLQLTLRSADAEGGVLGEYILEHTGAEPAAH